MEHEFGERRDLDRLQLRRERVEDRRHGLLPRRAGFIFSLSSGNDFDLGSYPQGQSRKTTFNKEGTFDVECAIHPEMKMVVKVEKK